MKQKNDESISFWDHVDEFRKIIIRLLLVWIILALGYFLCMDLIFDHFIMGPCHQDFCFYRLIEIIGNKIGVDQTALLPTHDITLVNYNLTSPFLIHISTSFEFAVVTTVPYLLYEIWTFIKPALLVKEKSGLRKAFFLGGVMFYIGGAVGYFIVFPMTLQFLINYNLSDSISNLLSLSSYMDNFTGLVVMMGTTFELPLVLWILGLFGVVDKVFLKKYRKYAFLFVVILAAIITPTGDPFTLTIVALPIWLLYEFSILLVPKKTETTN